MPVGRYQSRTSRVGGKHINATAAEDTAFFEWAIVEVLRHTGIRIEEALELTHLSIRQYQRPTGEIIALLVIAPSKSDRERVIPMSAELFSVIAAIIRRHTQDGQAIPLLSRYDPHERQASSAMPFLFQRKIGTNQEVISPATEQEWRVFEEHFDRRKVELGGCMRAIWNLLPA